MGSTIKRQKIVEREHFTDEEKMLIAKKSDDKCCCCGKTVFFGYGATVEHFIPLSKGGTNRDINLVMLCEDCNKKKNSFIYYPDDYLPYLKPEHLNKLQGYFKSYITSFEFVNRDNLLACDRYKVFLSPSENLERSIHNVSNKKRQQKYKQLLHKNAISLWVKRATMDDVDKLTEYFVKYLKKYNCLDDEEAARVNIEFWITFGCIYYIERNGEIKTFITVTVTKANNRVLINNDSISNFLTINVFTYYSNDYALTLAWNLSRQIPKHICIEQGIKQIPVKYCVVKKDSLSSEICDMGWVYAEDRFINSFLVLYDGTSIEDTKELPKISEDKVLNNFFNKFAEINESKIHQWFKWHDQDTFEWMLRELLLEERSDIDNGYLDLQLE